MVSPAGDMKVMAGVTSHGWCRLAGEVVVSPHGDTDERVGVARWGHGKEAVCNDPQELTNLWSRKIPLDQNLK